MAWIGTGVMAFTIATQFIVNPATSAAAQKKRCEDASNTLENLKTQYLDFINEVKKTEGNTTGPSEILKYTLKLNNEQLDNIAKFNELTNNKSKLYKTTQIISVVVVCVFIAVLSLKYLFSERIK